MNGDMAVLEPTNITRAIRIKARTNGISMNFLFLKMKEMNSFIKSIITSILVKMFEFICKNEKNLENNW